MFDIMDFHPSNPWRSVDWRWQLALHLADEPYSLLAKYADTWVEQALAFVTALRRCQTEEDREALAESFPELFQAHALHQQESPQQRWAVEARILAGEAFDQIGRKHGLDPGVVACYERLFFNVLDKLPYSDFIMTRVVGSKAYTGLTEKDLDVIWKLFGYLYGPLVLDTLIPLSANPGWLERTDQVDGTLEQDARLTLRLKMAVLLRMDLDQRAVRALFDLYLRLLKLEPEEAFRARQRARAETRTIFELGQLLAGAPGTPVQEDATGPPAVPETMAM